MRYLQALEQKGLKKEDLSKQTQKKIDELEFRKAQIEEEADDYDEEDLKEILEKIREFDEQLEKSIRKFNPEVYKKRVAVFERNKKLAKGEIVEEEYEEEYEEEEPTPTPPTTPVKQQPKEVVQVQEQPKVAKKSVSEKLDELESKVKTNPERFKAEPTETEEEDTTEEIEVEEIEDYKNKGTIKPKKMSTSIILMGVGAFLLTWGAVNFFRERR